MMSAPSPRGFTLVEALVVVAILAILLGMALPSFVGSMARSRLEGLVNELSTDLQYARSMAIRRRAAVVLATNNAGTGYEITLAGVSQKVVALPAGMTVTANQQASFDPLRGLASAVSIDASSDRISATLRVTTSAIGRVHVCSPDHTFGGYSTC